MSTTRQELHQLVDRLPEPALEELADLAREIARQVAAGEVEVVADPEEEALLLESLAEDPDEPVFTLEEATAFLRQHRAEHRP